MSLIDYAAKQLGSLNLSASDLAGEGVSLISILGRAVVPREHSAQLRADGLEVRVSGPFLRWLTDAGKRTLVNASNSAYSTRKCAQSACLRVVTLVFEAKNERNYAHTGKLRALTL